MWLYYAIIVLSVIMFGGGFALQDIYRKKRGSGLKISMESMCIGSASGLVVLFIINGLSFEFTAFTLIMALLAALNSMAFTFCAFKALDYINLSLFSLFAMLGGMVLPFFQGILFYQEEFSVAKGICVAFICASLMCTVDKGEKKNGTIFYIGVFILNGMSGVLSKIYTSSAFPKASAAGYSAWTAFCAVVLSGIVWTCILVKEKRSSLEQGEIKAVHREPIKRAWWAISSYGVINRVANFMLVIALAHVDASVQYPMVTGGTMIVSTAFSFLSDKKPNKKEILSIILSFLGMVALFAIPI